MVNNDVCVEQYRCATVLYLLSIFTHSYNIIMDCGVGSLVHVREVGGGLNATDKRFLLVLITTVQLPGTVDHDSQMTMYTSTANTYISLAR